MDTRNLSERQPIKILKNKREQIKQEATRRHPHEDEKMSARKSKSKENRTTNKEKRLDDKLRER